MVDVIPPNRRGSKTGAVQRPAFLDEVGVDMTNRDSPEVQELTQMLGGAEPVDEIPVHSDSLNESDQIEAALLALRNEPAIGRPAGDDSEADATVSHILRSTAAREGSREAPQRSHLSVVAAIRAEQEAEDADIDDDLSGGAGLDLREKTEEEIAAIGRLAPSAKQAMEVGKDQHVIRQSKPERSGTGRQTAKLYPDKPVAPVAKEPIREPEPELEIESELESEEVPEDVEPEVIFVPAKPATVVVEGAGGVGVGGHKVSISPPSSPRIQVSAERKLAREAGPKTEAKVEQQQQTTHAETLQSLLEQIEAEDESFPEPQPVTEPKPVSQPIPIAQDKLIFTTVIAKFERIFTQTYGGAKIEIWSSGKITVSGTVTGPQLRVMILDELHLQDE